MTLKCIKLLNTYRKSPVCSRCGFQFRRYCSKNDSQEPHSSSKSSSNSQKQAIPKEEFQYPEQRTDIVSTRKSLAHYFKEDVRNAFSFLYHEKDENYENRKKFQHDVEFLILGAGPVGTSIAFWLAKQHRGRMPVLVVDKNLSLNQSADSAEAEKISLLSSTSLLRQEYEIEEHVNLSRMSAELLRDIDSYAEDKFKIPTPSFQPFGILSLANDKGSEKLKKLHSDCLHWSGHNELLTAFQLNQRYPWMNTNDLNLAVHGLKNEGWYDPDMYLMKMRSCAKNLRKVRFIEAEPVEFVYDVEMETNFPGFKIGQYKPCNYIYLKLANGDVRKVQFGFCIIALELDAGSFIKDMLFINKKYDGMHQFEFPIVRRKRHIYNIIGPEIGPEISSPMVVDPTGLFVRRYGLMNEYICGCPPLMVENSPDKDLDAEAFFHKVVGPLLSNRIPTFEKLQVKSSETYYEDFNVFDGCPIIGIHPAYHNFLFAVGLGDCRNQFAPAIGFCVGELLRFGTYKTLDLTRLNFSRVVQEVPLFDSCIM